jgi:hypothetical protein
MTIEAKECVLGDFQVVALGVEFPSYFQGFGCSFTEFDHCTYGIGYTEAEALDDCIEMMAQSAGVDITDSDVQRIRAEYGEVDADTTVDDYLGRNDCDESDEDADDEDGDDCNDCDDGGEDAYYHVGIRWNEELKDA